jgi:putative transposase
MYTSQKCNSCGHTSKENRKTQSEFKCVECGHEQNADFQAATNILGEGIALKRKREAVACA